MRNQGSVLVVEDDEALRAALCDTINYGGYRAVSACNGAEALKRLESEPIDMVISDVQMEGIGGLGLVNYLQQHHSQLPILLMTAF